MSLNFSNGLLTTNDHSLIHDSDDDINSKDCYRHTTMDDECKVPNTNAEWISLN